MGKRRKREGAEEHGEMLEAEETGQGDILSDKMHEDF